MGTRSSTFIAADSNCVALPEGDYSFRLVGIHDGDVYEEIEHTEALTSIPVLSPDGSMVAAGTRSGAVVVWSAESGERLHRFADRREVRAVAFSPDGQHLVSGGQSGAAIFWHIGSGTAVRALTGLGPNVEVVAFSPDGRSLATGGQDKIVRIWDTATGALRLAHPCETGVISGLAFSPDGTRIACGTFDETAPVRVLDAQRGTELWRGVGHEMGVTTVAFSPDGRTIASGSQDMNVVLWDAQKGRVIRTLEETNHDVSAVAFAPDGGFLMAITRVFDDFIAPEGEETQWGAVVWDTTSWDAEVRLGAEEEEEEEEEDGEANPSPNAEATAACTPIPHVEDPAVAGMMLAAICDVLGKAEGNGWRDDPSREAEIAQFAFWIATTRGCGLDEDALFDRGAEAAADFRSWMQDPSHTRPAFWMMLESSAERALSTIRAHWTGGDSAKHALCRAFGHLLTYDGPMNDNKRAMMNLVLDRLAVPSKIWNAVASNPST